VIVMRTAILTFGFVMGMAAVGFAMPLAPSAGSPNSGWHRHDKNCNTLRGTVKNRNSAKS